MFCLLLCHQRSAILFVLPFFQPVPTLCFLWVCLWSAFPSPWCPHQRPSSLSVCRYYLGHRLDNQNISLFGFYISIFLFCNIFWPAVGLSWKQFLGEKAISYEAIIEGAYITTDHSKTFSSKREKWGHHFSKLHSFPFSKVISSDTAVRSSLYFLPCGLLLVSALMMIINL